MPPSTWSTPRRSRPSQRRGGESDSGGSGRSGALFGGGWAAGGTWDGDTASGGVAVAGGALRQSPRDQCHHLSHRLPPEPCRWPRAPARPRPSGQPSVAGGGTPQATGITGGSIALQLAVALQQRQRLHPALADQQSVNGIPMDPITLQLPHGQQMAVADRQPTEALPPQPWVAAQPPQMQMGKRVATASRQRLRLSIQGRIEIISQLDLAAHGPGRRHRLNGRLPGPWPVLPACWKEGPLLNQRHAGCLDGGDVKRHGPAATGT